MQLIPPYDHDFTAESNAERKFARLLAAVTGEDAVAFHSFHLSRHPWQQMGEADFVVLWKCAVLILEVKGGSLSRKDGKWYQEGRDGGHVLRRAPLDQAREARFAFSDLVKRRLGEDYSYGFALVTPDCMLEDDFEIGQHEYIGRKDMDVFSLRAKFDLLASVARRRPGRDGLHWPKKDLTPLRKIMRRDLDGMMTLVHQAEVVERRHVELLAEQIDFLEASRVNARIVLEGGAGTGKTLVALEGARREDLDGARVTFVCATEEARAMAERTLESATIDLALAFELPLPTPADLLVVDEAQDLMNAQDLDRIFISVEGGLDGGRWWLLADSNNQAHVAGAYEEDSYQLVTSTGNCARVRLGRNVRNTDPVIEATQIYLRADIGTPRVGEGPAVKVEKVKDSGQPLTQLIERIQKLKNEGVSTRQMAVVALDHRDDETTGNEGGIGAHVQGVRVWTPREIKGLEVQHVLVLGLDDLTEQRHRNLAYVAMTRPTISLWMAVSQRAYAQMMAMTAKYFSGRTGTE